MDAPEKSDCISIESALTELGIKRGVLNTYMNALNVTRHKYPLDPKWYITRANFERIKQAIEENR